MCLDLHGQLCYNLIKKRAVCKYNHYYYQSCLLFNVIFDVGIESESLHGEVLGAVSVWEREGGREGTVEIIANVSIGRSEKPEKAHWSL